MTERTAEQERLRFEGDLDKWMKTIGAGITGYQPEAYAVMDLACLELVKLRAAAEWQDISTAPNCVGAYLFCRLAWRNGNDICTGDGFRWGDKWFATGTFYKGGRFDECQYEMRQIEVMPTHWMESTQSPAAQLE